MSIKVIGVQHVALVVTDLDAADTFYEEVLGLARLPRPDFGFPGTWYACGPQAIHLFTADNPEVGRHHFAIEVNDLDGAVAALTAKGVDVRVAATFGGAGRQAFLKDPSGNRIELNEPQHSG